MNELAPKSTHNAAIGMWTSGVIYLTAGLITLNPITTLLSSLLAVISISIEQVSRIL